MARLKHLFVAILTAASGAYYLHGRTEIGAAQIRQSADDRLKGAQAAVAAAVAGDNQALLGQLKGLQLGAIAETMDDEGKPTAEALEAARTAVEKSSAPDAERPLLVVVAAQGVGGRYRLGQSNRFDKDLSAFPALTEPGPNPRSGVGVLDGQLSRFAVTQFEDTKVEGARGLLALAFPLDDGLAKRLQNAVGGLEIVVLQKDKVIGSTLAPAERQALQNAAGSNKGAFDFGAASGDSFAAAGVPLPLFAKPVRYRADVLATVPGLPADVRIVVATRVLERYAALAEDQKAVLGLFALLVIVSLLLMVLSGNPARGLSRVVTAAERLAQGDRDSRAPTDKMTPLVRRAAVAVNSLAGQVSVGPVPATPSFAEQLGIKASRASPSQPATREPLLASLSSESPPPGAFRPEPGLNDVDSFLSGNSNEPTTVLPPPGPSPATMPSPRATGPSSGVSLPPAASFPSFASPSSPSFPVASPGGGSSASSASFMPKAKPAASIVPPLSAPVYQAPSPDEFGHDQTVIAQTPEALIRATQRSTSFPSPPSSPPSYPGAPAPAVALPPPAASSEEAHFQQVFKEFVATREKCHEPADGLTFDKFAQKLRKNQEQLVQKYQCRTVRFQVYVKEGKAALKATPVR